MVRKLAIGNRLKAGLALSVTVLVTAQSHAQDHQPQQSGGSYVLAPVVINARRITEDLQKVPIAISVIDSSQSRNINPSSSNADVAHSSPNVNYVDMGGYYSNSMTVRGVGSISPLSADDSSVSLNVDEVPLSAYGVPPSTLDLERVEILRGPQGTLYGRNSQGGAINYISKKPVFANEYSIRGEAGNKNMGMGEIIANTELIKNELATRIAVRYSDRGGDISNKAISGEDGGVKVGGARGSLLYEPDADTRALLTFDFASNNDKQPQNILRNAYCYPCSGVNPRTGNERENYGGTYRFEHNFEAFRFTSISSIHRLNVNTIDDNQDMLIYQAYLGLPPSVTNLLDKNTMSGDQHETAYMQEIRLSSLENSTVEWTGGINYYRSEYNALQDGRNSDNGAFSGLQTGDLTSNSYAGFGEMTVPLIGELKGIAGLRVTHEEKNADYGFIGSGARGTVDKFAQDSNFDDTFVTGRAGLTYDWTTEFMTYGTVSRGAVAGGFPWHSVNNPFGKIEKAFPTSTSWTYETGFKSNLLDERATLNVALFYNDIKKDHQISFNPALLEYEIVALDYKTYGFEAEGRVMITDELTLLGGIGYTKAELTDLDDENLLKAKSGNLVPNVPEWTGNIGLEYMAPAERIGLNLGDIYASANYQYTDKRASDVRNSFSLEHYGLVNARLGWKSNNVEIYAFGNNLLDKRYEAFGAFYTSDVQVVRPGVGRTIGFGTSFRF